MVFYFQISTLILNEEAEIGYFNDQNPPRGKSSDTLRSDLQYSPRDPVD